MNPDKASVFIGVYRRSSAAIHVLAFFGSLARLRTISLHLLRIRRRVWQFLRLHYSLKKSLLGERLPRPFSALRKRQVSLALQRAFDPDSPPASRG
jgi:hypothetical protein